MDDAPIHRAHRRAFLGRASALGAASLLGLPLARAEPPPEVRRIRLVKLPLVCMAPLFLAEELLHLEGFEQVEWVSAVPEPGPSLVANGRADFIQWAMLGLIPYFDDGNAITLLAGVHSGCEELIAHSHVGVVRDLRGKRLAITAQRGSDHMHLASILAYIGIDPAKEVAWVVGSDTMDPERLFREREVDAFIGFAPQPQSVRAAGLGHTILDTATDRPWSQYYCCGLAAGTDFVRKYPVATKRAMRAILRGSDLCVRETGRVAKFLAERHEFGFDMAKDVLERLSYARWRRDNPADTLRFHGLRLHEVGLVRSTPTALIARGCDLRFLNELKTELKA